MTVTNMLKGRQVVASLTNQSGGAIIAGDVVIVSAANDESFTTTTSASYNSTRVGVALESIAAAAAGRILLEGYAPLVNVSASATRGHYLLTHTVAKQATSQAGYAAGAFGQILKAGTTPSAMLFPVAQVGSSGAPTTTPYVTTAADAGLSAEVVIPGLAGSADIAGAAGAGTAHEFEAGDTAPSWSTAPDTTDVGTTVKSHLYAQVTTNPTTYRYGTFAWSPAGDFDIRCCLDIALNDYTTTPDWYCGLLVQNSDDSVMAMTRLRVHTFSAWTKSVESFTYASSTWTQRGVSYTGMQACPKTYLRLKRVSGTFSFYFSANGLQWVWIASQALTITVTKIGFILYGDANITDATAIVDWLRTDV